MKSNEILGQILRNRYGSLRKTQLQSIIGAIRDGGLRLVRIFLLDESQVRQIAKSMGEKYPGVKEGQIRVLVAGILLFVCIALLERIGEALNKKEVRQLVDLTLGGEPADDVLRYLTWLDVGDRFRRGRGGPGGGDDVARLRRLWAQHKDETVRRIVSMATQKYMSTHEIWGPSRQAISAVLMGRG